MSWRYVIMGGGLVLAINVLVSFFHFRWDITADKRYSLSENTIKILSSLDQPIDVVCYIDGDVNSSFFRLEKAVKEILNEMQCHAPIDISQYDKTSDTLPTELTPIVVHEKGSDGKLTQMPVYPYLKITYDSKSRYVTLLENNRFISGAENINRSIECLEYTLMDAVGQLLRGEVKKIAWIVGRGELSGRDIADFRQMLEKNFVVTDFAISDLHVNLSSYDLIIIAGVHERYDEVEKYVIDQYIMNGGRVLWMIDGIRFSPIELSQKGSTPIIENNTNLEDMLFRYGVKILPCVVEDLQCLTVPVDVSVGNENSNFQPMPYYAYPLLLTSTLSPITKGVAQVSAKFISPVELVGENDGIKKDILLAGSSNGRIRKTPLFYQLRINENVSSFRFSHIPVAVSLEGQFLSYFAHRIPPQGVMSVKKNKSVETKQVVIGGSGIATNSFNKNQIFPVGFDLYSGVQYGNKDFLANCIRYLCDDNGLMNLRNKSVKLRLLNNKLTYATAAKIKFISLILPCLSLILIVMVVALTRKKKYCY